MEKLSIGENGRVYNYSGTCVRRVTNDGKVYDDGFVAKFGAGLVIGGVGALFLSYYLKKWFG